ncbi:hypothetical protein ACIG5C_25330 [Streptomyces werraensis]|uniref:hypothetical protein n=1 Tax=Streptomyces werraensis TaxID=68284 RepID=UPI001CE2AE83
MADAPHQRYAPGRLGVTEAAVRTGHTDAAGTSPGAVLPDVRELHERSCQAVALLAERGADAVDATGGMRDRADAGPPAVDAHGGNGGVS